MASSIGLTQSLFVTQTATQNDSLAWREIERCSQVEILSRIFSEFPHTRSWTQCEGYWWDYCFLREPCLGCVTVLPCYHFIPLFCLFPFKNHRPVRHHLSLWLVFSKHLWWHGSAVPPLKPLRVQNPQEKRAPWQCWCFSDFVFSSRPQLKFCLHWNFPSCSLLCWHWPWPEYLRTKRCRATQLLLEPEPSPSFVHAAEVEVRRGHG